MIEKIKQGFINYGKNTKGMTFKEKVSYTWEYYKLLFALIVAAVIFIVIVVSLYLNATTKIIISGVTVNTDLSLEGTDYITEQFYNLKKTHGRERVDISGTYMYDAGTTDNIEQTYDAIQSIVAQVSGKGIDYFITDPVGFECLVGQEIFMDLSEMYTDKELESFGDKVVYAKSDEDEKPVPVGITITDLKFIEENSLVKSTQTIICFAVNTQNKDTCREFLQYISDYGK